MAEPVPVLLYTAGRVDEMSVFSRKTGHWVSVPMRDLTQADLDALKIEAWQCVAHPSAEFPAFDYAPLPAAELKAAETAQRALDKAETDAAAQATRDLNWNTPVGKRVTGQRTLASETRDLEAPLDDPPSAPTGFAGRRPQPPADPLPDPPASGRVAATMADVQEAEEG